MSAICMCACEVCRWGLTGAHCGAEAAFCFAAQVAEPWRSAHAPVNAEGQMRVVLLAEDAQRAMDEAARRVHYYHLHPEEMKGGQTLATLQADNERGCLAEMAVAVALAEQPFVTSGPDAIQGDVGGRQVRSTVYRDGHLLLRRDEEWKAQHPFVLVLTCDAPRLTVAGWCYGSEIRDGGLLLSHLPKPAWGRKWNTLHSMATVPAPSSPREPRYGLRGSPRLRP